MPSMCEAMGWIFQTKKEGRERCQQEDNQKLFVSFLLSGWLVIVSCCERDRESHKHIQLYTIIVALHPKQTVLNLSSRKVFMGREISCYFEVCLHFLPLLQHFLDF